MVRGPWRAAAARGDGLGARSASLPEDAGQGQPGAPLLQCQEDVALAAEVHQVALPVAELAAQMRFVGRWWIGVRWGWRARGVVATPPATLRLALREQRGSRATTGRTVGMAVDGLRADRVLRSSSSIRPAICSATIPRQGGPRRGRAGGWSARSSSRAACAPTRVARRCPAGSRQRTDCARARAGWCSDAGRAAARSRRCSGPSPSCRAGGISPQG